MRKKVLIEVGDFICSGIPERVELQHGADVFGDAEELIPRCMDVKKVGLARIVLRGPDVVHYHKKTLEVYIIESGEGRLFFNGQIAHIYPGDRIIIPPGKYHAAKPHENSTPLTFLCISVPAFNPKDVFKAKIG